MVPHSLLILISLSAAAAVTGRAQQPLPASPSVYVQFDGGAATLDGYWQFHLGDNPAWASPAFDDSGWEKLAVDKPWGAQTHFSAESFGWYRRQVRLAPGAGNPETLAILLPFVEDAYEVYWNGQLVGKYGSFPPRPVWYSDLMPRSFGLGTAMSGVLAVRVWKSPLDSSSDGKVGGFYAPPVLGSPSAIEAAMSKLDYHWLQSRQLSFAFSALYALVGIFGLLAWLLDRRQWLSFWMGWFAAARPMAEVLLRLKLPIPFLIAMGLNQPVYVLGDITLWFLLLWLLDLRDDPRLMKLAKVLGWIMAAEGILDFGALLGFMLPNPVPFQILDGALMPLVILLELFPIYIIAAAVFRQRKLEPARWTVALLAFLYQSIFTTSVALQQGSRFTHWTLGTTMGDPMFMVFGNGVTAREAFGILLLVALVYAVYRYSVESRRQQALLEQEMRNAREVQQVLVPEEIPTVEGFSIQSVYKPAGEVGGDFFQILPLRDGGVLIVIGDVSGKGMPAAMTVSLLVGTVRTLAHYTQSPGSILGAMNQRMLGRQQGGFTTCLVLRADSDGTLTLANAGHPAPYRNGKELEVDNGLPLGLDVEATYSETAFELGVNERITLVSDGVVEARGKTGELFGFERAAALSMDPAERIASAAEAFGQDDDITVVTLTRLPVPAKNAVERPAPSMSPLPV
jgi:hypothetical protein